jgi:hypothetical protein
MDMRATPHCSQARRRYAQVLNVAELFNRALAVIRDLTMQRVSSPSE